MFCGNCGQLSHAERTDIFLLTDKSLWPLVYGELTSIFERTNVNIYTSFSGFARVLFLPFTLILLQRRAVQSRSRKGYGEHTAEVDLHLEYDMPHTRGIVRN